MKGLLVSVDVGGTLGHADGPSLAAILSEASSLAPADARQIIRQKLHIHSAITPQVVADVCDALLIPLSAFPCDVEPLPLRLAPCTLAALRSMSRFATLVTLSNVTCLEAGTDQIRDLLHPWVREHFPSCRIGYAKPDPTAWHHVARACYTRAAHMVHIGDDWTCDVLGARSAGVIAIWVSYGRPIPEPDRLADPGVLVVADLAAASRRVTELVLRGRL